MHTAGASMCFDSHDSEGNAIDLRIYGAGEN
jgi:hypothetical protein